MKTERITRLRLYTCDGHRVGGKPLHEVAVQEAQTRGMSGATVFRAARGFGVHDHLHTARVLSMSTDMPILVEILDQREKVDAFLAWLDQVTDRGMVTIEEVDVVHLGS